MPIRLPTAGAPRNRLTCAASGTNGNALPVWPCATVDHRCYAVPRPRPGQDGDRETMIEALYQAWCADTRAGHHSWSLADAATVMELNQRAQADLIVAGQVGTGGVTTADGTTIGTGGLLVTRLNRRDPQPM